MPELDDALTTFAAWLDALHVPYMVIGGFAVTVWGEPRFTRDLDVTISVPPAQLESMTERLAARFTCLVSDPVKFVRETRVLPILVGSVPVDVVFAGLPYEEEAIARAKPIHLKKGDVRICAPEDLILHKVVSNRPRDHADVEGIFRYRHGEIDYAYLDPRVDELAEAMSDHTMLDWYRGLRQRWERS